MLIGQQETIGADAEAQILSGNPTLHFGRRRMLAERSVSTGGAVTVALFLGELCWETGEGRSQSGSGHRTGSPEVTAVSDDTEK